MQIRKFEARTMAEALKLVKKELGPDAVILSTSSSKSGAGSFGLFGSSMVEITAALDRTPPVVRTGIDYKGNSPLPPSMLSGDKTWRESAKWEDAGALREEIKELRRVLAEMKEKKKNSDGKMPSLPKPFEDICSAMISNGVMPRLARSLVEKGSMHLENCLERKRAGAISLVKEAVAMEIMSLVKVSGDIKLGGQKGRVAAFIGPTGVGKTTTMAKLAAKYCRMGKSVALITIDTYRIGAVEQFKTYAKILKSPALLASTPRELRAHIDSFRNKDLILVDTAGRSQRDESQISFLKEFFPGDQDRTELHLLMSATTHDSGISDIVKRFASLPVQRYIFTKLDECSSFGPMLNALARHKLNCSYFTTGQRVPEDLEAASPERMADLILRIREEADGNRLNTAGGMR